MSEGPVSSVYFSPTATTRAVITAIGEGIGWGDVRGHDMTLPVKREQPLELGDESLVLIGTPVYGGRVPPPAAAVFNTMNLTGRRCVLVVVYGNREFEDALLELKDICVKCGGNPVAGAAFIGEHSFSTEAHPLAAGRPDNEDLAVARKFGTQIAERVKKAGSGQMPAVAVPGNFPYKERKVVPAAQFIQVTDACTACGTCVAVCPMDAVDEADGFRTIDDRCIHCCACIKACPETARDLIHDHFKTISGMLYKTCTERKAPAIFLP